MRYTQIQEDQEEVLVLVVELDQEEQGGEEGRGMVV